MNPQIVTKVAQLLQQGVPEAEIISGMVEAQIPQEVAQQAIAEAKQGLSGGNEPGRPEGERSNSQGLAQIRQIITDIGPERVLQVIQAIMSMDGGELNALVKSLQGGSVGEENNGEGQQGQPQPTQPQGQPQSGQIPAGLEV